MHIMEETERLHKQKELIERIGRQNEKEGYQPVTARILGLLMVMDKEEFTFDEIVREMKISKSSASIALKNLEIRNMIEYVTYPGDRKRYFRMVSVDVHEMLDEFEKQMVQKMDIIKEIINLKKNKESKNAVFLQNVMEGMDYFLQHVDRFRQEYERKH